MKHGSSKPVRNTYKPGNRDFLNHDASVPLQTVGPTAQDAVVIPGEDNNDYTDIYKANLAPAGHAGAAQSKEKPSTSYTLTVVKTRRVQASSPFLQKPDLSIASNKVTASHPDVTQARGNKF